MDKLHDNIADSRGRRRTSKLLLVLFVVMLLSLAVGATYIWQQGRADTLNQRVTQLDTELYILKSQNRQAESPASKTLSAQPTYTYKSDKSVSVKVFSPQSNQKISNPLAIVGEVPGSWSFEASFPVVLMNSDGKVIVEAPAQVLGDWITERLVPFSAQLTWPVLETGNGTLVLKKDNPSGLSENDDSVSIPIKF